jgi:hypothetical protein
MASRVDACDDALDEMLDYFAAMGGMVTPQELYALSPVDPYEKDLDIRVDWWRTWLSSPEGRDADPIIREAVKIHIEANWRALGFQQMSIARRDDRGNASARRSRRSGARPS